MHKFGLVNKIRAVLFTRKFSWWLYKQSIEEFEWLEDNWLEFWDGYGELLSTIGEIYEARSEKEACDRWVNMDICKTYYFWTQERHWSKADLVADVLYLLWMTPQEA